MNIIIITAMFPPIRTGTSFYSANLAKALSDRGHNITIITLDNARAGSAKNMKYSVERIPALHFPVKKILKHFRVCSLSPLSYIKINRITKHARADVILLINHYLDIAFPAILSSRVNKIPILCSVGTQIQSCNPMRNRILNFFDKLICGNLVFPFCERIIAWDNEIRRYLDDVHKEKFVNKYAIVNYGVNGDMAEFLGYNHDYSTHGQILGIGAVSEQRSFISLVKAFSLIACDYPELRLKIIGHVYYDAAVKLAQTLGLEERIVFTGEIPHEKVLEELKNSDAYFVSLTAKYSGLGTATIESMLMGIPVIANVPYDLLGGPVLKDMENIVLLDNIEPGLIADRLRLLIKRKNLRETIGKGARDFIAKHMNWRKVALDMEILLKDVVDEFK